MRSNVGKEVKISQLYHKKWDVKNDFAYVLQFFSFISDSLGSVKYDTFLHALLILMCTFKSSECIDTNKQSSPSYLDLLFDYLSNHLPIWHLKHVASV